ncbi:MAG: aminotransferase class III-fold pyridoxal phosphate-dependent enzyme [Pirellulales bacterium]|nr:aminotransferase class III-fold pyridoxal phosphate-dependent enzyme [Pirellulales bacterium]
MKLAGLDLFPGASNGEFGLPRELVPVLERGAGCRVWDTAGREYLDMTMAWGAALVGHAHPKVVEAATAQARLGANFAAVNQRSIELAERLAQISPCIERVRLVASGSEATLLCVRVARAATGRPKVLKFEGAYHGQHPIGVASMIGPASDALPRPDLAGAGAPWLARDLVVAPYNDLARAVAIIAEHAESLAAVIVEPLCRCLSPAPGFLEGIRAATRRHGVALIFDEVVTGFRLALGGAQEYYGVIPDLVAYGKALGGGFPIGAYGGRADWMEVLAEQRIEEPNYVWSASTTGGNPVSCAAALAALDLLAGDGVYPWLRQQGARLRERMADLLRAHGETAQVLGDGPLAQVVFAAHPVVDHRTYRASDRARGRRLQIELVRQGVFLNPMGTKLYLSLAHDDRALDEFSERFAVALTRSRDV